MQSRGQIVMGVNVESKRVVIVDFEETQRSFNEMVIGKCGGGMSFTPSLNKKGEKINANKRK